MTHHTVLALGDEAVAQALTDRSPSPLPERIHEQKQAVREALEGVRRAASRLKRDPTASSAGLIEALHARDVCAAALGQSVAAWLAQGHEIRLVPRRVEPAPSTRRDAPQPSERQPPQAPAAAPVIPEPAPTTPVPARAMPGPSPTTPPTTAQASDSPPTPERPAPTSTPAAPEPLAASPPAEGSAAPIDPQVARDLLRKQWKEGGGPAHPAPAAPASTRLRHIEALARRWGAPDDLDERAIHQISQATGALDDWLELPREDQRRLMAYAAARARALQEVHPDFPGEIFHRLTRWSAEHRPGAVRGLNRAHLPDGASWVADATKAGEVLGLLSPPEATRSRSFTENDLVSALNDNVPAHTLRQIVVDLLGAVPEPRLINLLNGKADLLRGEPKLKKLRKQLRRAARQPAPPAPSPAAPWPYRPRTQGMQVLMVGGDNRPGARARLEEAFGFTIVWDTGWNPRRYQAGAERIERSRYGMVLIVGDFVTHKSSRAIVSACKRAQVPFGLIQKGYGVAQVGLAIQKALGLSDPEVTDPHSAP